VPEKKRARNFAVLRSHRRLIRYAIDNAPPRRLHARRLVFFSGEAADHHGAAVGEVAEGDPCESATNAQSRSPMRCKKSSPADRDDPHRPLLFFAGESLMPAARHSTDGSNGGEADTRDRGNSADVLPPTRDSAQSVYGAGRTTRRQEIKTLAGVERERSRPAR
jgi:hypothetical protein